MRCDINHPAFEHLWHIISKGRMEMAIDLIKLPQILWNSFRSVRPFVACWRECLVFQIPPMKVWEMVEHLLLIRQHRSLCLTTMIVRKCKLTTNMWVHLQGDCCVTCTEFTGFCRRKIISQPIQGTFQTSKHTSSYC